MVTVYKKPASEYSQYVPITTPPLHVTMYTVQLSLIIIITLYIF